MQEQFTTIEQIIGGDDLINFTLTKELISDNNLQSLAYSVSLSDPQNNLSSVQFDELVRRDLHNQQFALQKLNQIKIKQKSEKKKIKTYRPSQIKLKQFISNCKDRKVQSILLPERKNTYKNRQLSFVSRSVKKPKPQQKLVDRINKIDQQASTASTFPSFLLNTKSNKKQNLFQKKTSKPHQKKINSKSLYCKKNDKKKPFLNGLTSNLKEKMFLQQQLKQLLK